MKKIEIMGCGYIGLPTAVTFTLAGYEVCGFDVKAETVEILSQGKINIVEPGLQEALTEAMATGRLHFTTTPEPADVFIIAVQTPYRETPEKKRVSDMRFVESAAREVGRSSITAPSAAIQARSTARRRPFGEQYPAETTRSRRPSMRLVNWPWRKRTASLPSTRRSVMSATRARRGRALVEVIVRFLLRGSGKSDAGRPGGGFRARFVKDNGCGPPMR